MKDARFTRLRRLLAVMLVAYVLSVAAVCVSGLRDNVQPADVALVLGNRVDADGTLSPRLAARVDEALRLYRLGYFKLIVVSGAIGGEGLDEAAHMRKHLIERGVPSDAIIADNLGVNTYESARNLKALLAERNLNSVMVISQYFHMPRCRLALSRFGVAPVYWSHARYFEWQDLLSMQREVFALVKYSLRSY